MNKIRYIITAYLPGFEDTCMGCHMDFFDSDFQICSFSELDEVTEFIRYILFETKRGIDYEFRIIINGILVCQFELRKPRSYENIENTKMLNVNNHNYTCNFDFSYDWEDDDSDFYMGQIHTIIGKI